MQVRVTVEKQHPPGSLLVLFEMSVFNALAALDCGLILELRVCSERTQCTRIMMNYSEHRGPIQAGEQGKSTI